MLALPFLLLFLTTGILMSARSSLHHFFSRIIWSSTTNRHLQPSLLSFLSRQRMVVAGPSSFNPSIIILRHRASAQNIIRRPYSMTNNGNEPPRPPKNQLELRSGPFPLYMERLQDEQLQYDQFQMETASRLQRIYEEHKAGLFTAPFAAIDQEESWFSTLGRSLRSRRRKGDLTLDAKHQQGIYVHGGVGTGKTMIMDLYFESFDLVDSSAKKRVHFHSFMMDIHTRIFHIKARLGKDADAVNIIADEMAKEARLLCFDEFMVTDIADAMILRALLSAFFRRGMVIFFTSNRHPSDLYINGIQRESFLPCIDLILRQSEIINLDSGIDYRRSGKVNSQFYLTPVNEATTDLVHKSFQYLTQDLPPAESRSIVAMGRSVVIPKCSGDVAMFTFDDLCGSKTARSAVDYLTICKEFKTIFITEIPVLSFYNDRNEVRRFINLIDTLFDSKVRVYCQAETDIDEIFSKDMTPEDRARTDEEIFAANRARSRLVEMCSGYISTRKKKGNKKISYYFGGWVGGEWNRE